ncbi:NADH-quinone oxidoreductase subunit L [Flavihumibacter profundi]|uniref:NADH-quinone oxidoreductase subunit L n=1 Tax=Flavihumibacter profundi TaxID=2716883 RepID=UPI001CC6CC61|nr:NADH-quinone oxidoreductase subunit L [Flavihumibacter profundi]MBZ5857791.1 NADH-quinone oxidoreductase subunit L [Flavihumibacter profundi]
MLNVAYIAAIPLLPLACFVVLGLFGKEYFSSSAGFLGTVALAGSAVLSLQVAWQYFFVEGKVNGIYQQLTPLKLTWLSFSPSLSIDLGIILDPISVMMIVIVSFVSLMVHIFSLWYMKGEERFATYYAFLSLFTFSMLGLVLSANLFQIYIFWELVGVSSFLLIGYYYQKPSAVAAAKKAFIVTRFADFGFLVGILVLAFYSNTLDFGTLIARLTDASSAPSQAIHTASFLGISALTWALALVFTGGAGKSAMFPLHIWLPDAMEGPTPVSALIHAATMVVAGVSLVARLFPLFSLDPAVLTLIRYTGIISACIAAIIACTQTDIKRVLAFSTMSQIGYMMFALGLSPEGGDNSLGYMGSMFHLFTHAFFKSLLFLCAGAIIHFVHSNDLRDMGGLRKLMPITHITFLVACLAIAGIPPFAGFFSKEEILMAASESNKAIYLLAPVIGGLTAFYMFRLYFSIFWSKAAVQENHHGEGNIWMKIPLLILAACSLLAGLLPFSEFITANGRPLETHINLGFSVVPVLLAVTGIALAAWLYKTANDKPAKLATSLGGFYQAAYKKFYIDELYLFITKKILFNLVGRPAAWFDRNIVDGTMNLLASTTAAISDLVKGWQSGQVQRYAIYFFGGIFTLGVIFIYLWK